VDASGRIIREVKMGCEPAALITWFGGLDVQMTRIGLEAGPLSQWLFAGMREARLAVELLETRHVRAAFKAMPVKTDRNDARGIAQLMRLGWFRPVHCKSLPAQELRAVLTARKLLQGKRHDVEMSLRGILRGFGLKVGPTTTRSFEGRIRELVEGHATLVAVADALLLARETLGAQLGKLQKRLVSLARDDARARLLMSVPGVGVLVALTYVAAIDDPGRFKSSKATGAHFGLTPKKYNRVRQMSRVGFRRSEMQACERHCMRRRTLF
jgi:transposase